MLTDTRYDIGPIGLGKNWVTDVGGLPAFVRAVAHALIRNGHSESEAIQLAIGTIKRWAAGGGKVTAKTRAKAAATVAEWEAKKAASHAGRDMGPMLESSSAGDLLPVAPIPQPPKPREATTLTGPHRFAGNNLTACARCGRPINAKVHANRRKARRRTLARIDELTGTRHRGLDGHVPVHGGHANTPAKARTVQLKAHHASLDRLESGVTDAMKGLFADQKTSALARLHGKRGSQMVARARQELNARFDPEEPRGPDGKWGSADEMLRARHPDVDSFTSENDQRIVLHKVVVPKDARNKGEGSAFIRDLTKYADKHNKRIDLTPSSDFGGSKSRLVGFYQQHGFVQNKGRNRDLEISEDMYRPPAGSRAGQRDSPPPSASGGATSASGGTTEAALAADTAAPAAVVDPAALFDPAYWTPRTAQSFAPTNAAAGEIGAQRVHTGLGGRAHDIDDTGARTAMNGALDAHATSTAGQVTDTTRRELTDSLNEGIHNGESTPQLASRVSDIFDNASNVRAEMIARTYTNSAVNGASLAYAQHLPPAVAAKKEWSSLHDPRVRPHHLEADGQKQTLDVPFNVGGYALQHPGDPTAPLSEIANCRCTLLYE